MTDIAEDREGDAGRGLVLAIISYLIWGFMPFFMKAVAHIPSAEVVAHRILWSIPIAAVVLVWLGRTADLKVALRSRRTLLMATLTAAIISVNWGIYVWAIAVDRTVETALGYYINPLMNVVVGAVLLGERLTRAQMVAVAMAAVAVVIMTADAGHLPWVSLGLAASFSAYGYFRKTLPIGPSQGFFLEVLILALPAAAYIAWLQITGEGHFFAADPRDAWLLMAAGPLTAVPLLLFGFGARLLKLSTIGLMQYIAPTMIFVIAVFAFGEPFTPVKALAFGLIWAALALYTWSMLATRSARASG